MQQASWYIAKLKSPIQPISRWLVRQIAARKGPRTLLNRYYGWLDYEAKSRFDQRYSKVFRSKGLFGGAGVSLAPGEWIIQFIDRKIRLPLRPSWAWLDWDHAVSTLGNDVEVIQTYAALIQSDQRPALFLDVGANYGMHSLLFRSAGIPVVAFEPNPTCLAQFQIICELNNLAGRWESVAIGSASGQIELVYPEKDPWLGSVSSEVISDLANYDNVIKQQVPLKMLDEYLGEVPLSNVLIKIDVEGYEAEVIKGATQLLRHCKPKLVFESNDARLRNELFQVIAERGYSVHKLPWRASAPSRPMDIAEFLKSTGTNFMAMPRSPVQQG